MNKNIAKKLETLRKQNELTQEALAEKLGVSRQAVSNWELGNASPDTDNLIALAKLYGVKVDDLLIDTGDQMDFKERREAFFGMGIGDEEKQPRTGKFRAVSFPFPVLAVIAYFIVTYTTKRWELTWMIFLSVPVYYYIVFWIEQASGKANRHWMELFPYPLIVAAVFLLIGFTTNAWHPVWILFLTIPIYFFILKAIQNRKNGWRALLSGVYPTLTVIAFLLIGFLVPGGWNWSWIIFLTFPIWSWILKSNDNSKRNETLDK